MQTKEKHLKDHQEQALQRYNDRKTQIPIANMSFKDTIPFVSIIGPANTGKSKLFNALINCFTKKETRIENMITFATSKNKFTLFKADSNIESYIDVSKVSDLVILTINGDSLELDTFEIIGLMKAHGMSKVLVALTNLNNKKFKDIKKRMWTEIADGIKLFNIDIESNVDKMARYIKAMKYRPIQWRCNNSYVIADRIGITKDKEEYHYQFYGYIRGCPFKEKLIHIPGKGTYNILNKEIIQDPCHVSEGKVLDRERKMFYAPKFINENNIELEEEQIKEDSKIDEYNDSTENEKFILFNMKEVPQINEVVEPIHDTNSSVSEKMSEINEQIKTPVLDNIDELLDSIKSRFSKKPETKEDYIEKFNEEYKENGNIINEREDRLAKEAKNLLNLRKYIPGHYIKIEISSKEKIFFDSLTILGSIKISQAVTIQGRVKKTNHFPYILKSNQKYLLSIGWKRETTDIVFSYKDPTRNRYLKYLLANSHCNANFYSGIELPGTPFCIIQAKKYEKCDQTETNITRNNKFYKETEKFFRLAAIGSVTDVSGITDVVKKLKLIGYPKKIVEHTVIVKDMFTSDKEVAKFEGALLKTVGGLRGSIKKGVGTDGTFRATFEGRILMSDIIFLRCYVQYEVHDNEIKIPIKTNVDKPRNNEQDLTQYVERKKKFKTDKVIKNLKSNLTLDRQEIINENIPFLLPISPLDSDFNKLKSNVEEKRNIQRLIIEKRNSELEKKAKIEELNRIKEKKERLRKNILESQYEKKIIKKKHKPKRKNK